MPTTIPKIVKNEQRRAIVARYAQRRAELKETIRRPSSTIDERVAAQAALQRLPRDSSAVRLRNRDAVDGRRHDREAVRCRDARREREEGESGCASARGPRDVDGVDARNSQEMP